MKRVIYGLTILVGLCSTPALAQDQAAQGKPGLVAAEEIETMAMVRDVNREERLVTLETEDGRVATLRVPDEAQNLDQVKPGSKFKIRYIQSVVLGISDEKTAPSAQEVEKMELAPKGATPGGMIVNVKQVTATVEAIDYDKRTVAVKGPAGKVTEYKVGPEVERFNNIKVGDTIVLRYTEAIGMSMVKE